MKIEKFICKGCGAWMHIEQDTDKLKYPTRCWKDQGGCGRNKGFKLVI